MEEVAAELQELRRKEGRRVKWGEEAVAGSIIWQTLTAPGLHQRLCNSGKELKTAQDIAASAVLT